MSGGARSVSIGRLPTTTRLPRPDVPADRDLAVLRRLGALPPERPAVPILTKALHAPSPASGPVIAHLDPGQLRAPAGAATVYHYGPSRVDSYVGDLAVFGDGSYVPHFHLEFWDLPRVPRRWHP